MKGATAMRCYTSYKVKIKNYNDIFKPTVSLYNKAVNFFVLVTLNEWGILEPLRNLERCRQMELFTIKTKNNPTPIYNFSGQFYKFPSYLRRAAINEATGMVSSYQSNLKNWSINKCGKAPKIPQVGGSMPAMYRDNCFVMTGTYTAKLKVFIRNTWDWLEVTFKKSDIDYINRYCKDRIRCVSTLQKVGKQWFLRFAFEEQAILNDKSLSQRLIMGVDLGINNACVCNIMDSNGTIYGRKFLSLPKEIDSLNHAINRIKKAQQHGNHKTPRLWATANGINDDIAVKTANFIINTAINNKVDVIVFEHLDLTGRKRGSKKQKLALWKARYVQSVVTTKAHRLGIRISRVNAWNTSRLAYDGSGVVERGRYLQNGIEKHNYSVCVFKTGKVYNCDLNASYNIAARYIIRELLKSLSATVRLDTEAKVPQCTKRSTCTLSTLFSLNAVLAA